MQRKESKKNMNSSLPRYKSKSRKDDVSLQNSNFKRQQRSYSESDFADRTLRSTHGQSLTLSTPNYSLQNAISHQDETIYSSEEEWTYIDESPAPKDDEVSKREFKVSPMEKSFHLSQSDQGNVENNHEKSEKIGVNRSKSLGIYKDKTKSDDSRRERRKSEPGKRRSSKGCSGIAVTSTEPESSNDQRSVLRRTFPSADSSVKSGDLSKSSSARLNTRDNVEQYSVHCNEIVKWFCTGHNSLCCEKCTTDSHSKCEIDTLDDHLIRTNVSQLKQQSVQHGKTYLSCMFQRRNEIKQKQLSLEKQEHEIMDHVVKTANDLIDHIKFIRDSKMKIVNDLFKDKQNRCEKELKVCEDHINKLTNCVQQLDAPKSTKMTKLRKFENIKCTAQVLAKEGVKIDDVMRRPIEIEQSVFEVNLNLQNGVLLSDNIGDIVSETKPTGSMSAFETSSCTEDDESLLYGSSCDDDFSVKRVIDYSMLTAWTPGDTVSKTDISCIKHLQDGSILICDIKNRKVKWFICGEDGLKIKSTSKFAFKPWYIENITENKYLVTFPDSNVYMEFYLSDHGLDVGQRVAFDAPYPVCTKADNSLVFLNTKSRKFLTTDLDGNNKRPTFNTAIRKQLRRPNFLLYSSTTNLLYVNDPDQGVFGLDMGRQETVFRYSSSKFLCPMEITFSTEGHILVISNQSNNIHCISNTDGSFLYSISLDNLPYIGNPQCICFMSNKNEYLLSFAESHRIVKFKI